MRHSITPYAHARHAGLDPASRATRNTACRPGPRIKSGVTIKIEKEKSNDRI